MSEGGAARGKRYNESEIGRNRKSNRAQHQFCDTIREIDINDNHVQLRLDAGISDCNERVENFESKKFIGYQIIYIQAMSCRWIKVS